VSQRQARYKCLLVSKSGFVQECVFRHGDSPKAVLEELESFQWEDGAWIVTFVCASVYDQNNGDECEDEGDTE